MLAWLANTSSSVMPGTWPEDDLLDIGLDLRRGVGELVERVVDLLGTNAILHRNGDGDKDVVAGLRLDGQRDLVDSQAR